MNDFDDLFKKEDKDIYSKEKKNDDIAFVDEKYFLNPNQLKINFFLFLIYIGVILVMNLVAAGLMNNLYPGAAEYKSNLHPTATSPEFSIVDSTDPNNPYKVIVNADIVNGNNVAMPKMYVKIEFYNEKGDIIGTYIDFGDNIASGADFVSSGSVDLPSVPTGNSFDYGYSFPSLFLVSIQFAQVFITAIAFLALDFKSYKMYFKDFFKKFNTRFVEVVVGFGLLYVVLYLSQVLLSALGVTQTSDNEMTIRSLFNTNPLNLVMLFLLLCIVTPLVEETLFRKVIYNFIQKRGGNVVAIIGSGAIFGLMHVVTYGDFIQAIPYVGMGIVLGYMYYRAQKNLLVTMSIHFINNFITFAIYVMMIFGITSL